MSQGTLCYPPYGMLPWLKVFSLVERIQESHRHLCSMNCNYFMSEDLRAPFLIKKCAHSIKGPKKSTLLLIREDIKKVVCKTMFCLDSVIENPDASNCKFFCHMISVSAAI